MGPIGNALEVLKVATDPAAVERARSMMARQFKVMTRLVDDLLDLPRLAHGKMRVTCESLDLVQLVRDVAGDRRGSFEAAGVVLSLDLPAEPAATAGDPLRLSQVVGNVLANALKFTDRGGEVRVRLTADPVQRTATIAVQDSGIGIDPAVLPKLFEPFVQADRAVERSRGGLGLGLALVKGIVELHGGRVRVSSRGLGKGAEFVIELPLIAVEASAARPDETAPEAAAGRRVLVIEDNEDAAESLKTYLELLGHEVAVARTGPDGVLAAASSCPDVVVCDIGLPGMTGHVVCAELRKLPGLANTLFVALSGHAADSPASDRGAGRTFDLYLLKPVDPQRLAQAVGGTDAPRPGRAPEASDQDA